MANRLEKAKEKSELFNLVTPKGGELEPKVTPGDQPPAGSSETPAPKSPREKKKSKDTPAPIPETPAPAVPTVPTVADFVESLMPKRKTKRLLRGIYFDPDVDEALEKLKNSGIELSRFVNDIVKKSFPEGFLSSLQTTPAPPILDSQEKSQGVSIVTKEG